MQNTTYTLGQKAAAWAVHAFTASGIVAGFFAIVAISQNQYALAFSLLFLTLIIDGVDGTLARLCKVEEVLPQMSGKMIDSVIDFATYAIIPAYLIYSATIHGVPIEQGGSFLVPDPLRGWLAALIVLVSAIYYGKEGMISEDKFFIGFPVLWNLVAFYLYYVFDFSPFWNALIIVLCAILHFVPLKYIYPSRTRKLMGLNIAASVLALASNFLLMFLLEWHYMQPTLVLGARVLSILTIIYCFVISIYFSYFDKDTRFVRQDAESLLAIE